MRFADDYRNYIKQFGCMVIGSREFTGISLQENYNVVSITTAQRRNNKDISKNWYVLEQLNIDGIVIWQSSDGEVFQTYPNSNPEKIANSLSEYIHSSFLKACSFLVIDDILIHYFFCQIAYVIHFPYPQHLVFCF